MCACITPTPATRSHLFFLVDLTKYGSHVYVLVRRGELRASKIMAKRLLGNPKIVRADSTFQPTCVDTIIECSLEHGRC